MVYCCSPNQAWSILRRHAREDIGDLRLQELCSDEDRIHALMEVFVSSDDENSEIWIDFSRQRLTTDTFFHLLRLATSVQLRPYIRSLSSNTTTTTTTTAMTIQTNEDSEDMNTTARKNPYMMLRNIESFNDDNNDNPTVMEWNRIESLSEKIRRGQKRGISGSNLTNLLIMNCGSNQVVMKSVQFVVQALSVTSSGRDALSQHTTSKNRRQVRYCHEFHPITLYQKLQDWNPSTTIVILLSLDNDNQQQQQQQQSIVHFFQQWLSNGTHTSSNSSSHSTANKFWKKQMFIIQRGITSAAASVSTSRMENNNIFLIPPDLHPVTTTFTSAGLLPLSILFGWNYVAVPLLQGAHQMDVHFTNANPRHNLPVLLALVDTWNQVLSSNNEKTIPTIDPTLSGYSAMISSMEAHLHNRHQTPFYTDNDNNDSDLNMSTSSLTTAKMNNPSLPTEFIVTMDSSSTNNALAAFNIHRDSNEVNNISTCLAYADVLAFGSSSILVPTNFVEEDGNRPSTIITYSHMNAHMCGQSIAMTEHRTLVTERLLYFQNCPSFMEASSTTLAIPSYQQILKEKWIHMKNRLYSGKTALPEDDEEEEEEEENGHASNNHYRNKSNAVSQYNMATNIMMSHIITRSVQQQYQPYST